MNKKHPRPIREIGRCDVKGEPYKKESSNEFGWPMKEDYKLR